MTLKLKPVAVVQMERDDAYDTFERQIAERVRQFSGPVFTTDVDVEKLWAAYLLGIPEGRRAHYVCNNCRRFIQRFGDLVTIDEDGNDESLLWDGDGAPAFFTESVGAMERLVARAKVNGVFVWDAKKEGEWGHERTGQWSHLAGRPTAKPATRPLKQAHEVAAELKEDFGVLSRGLSDFGIDVVRQAKRVLEQGDLFRSEKATAVTDWFLALQAKREGEKNLDRRANLVWLAVATAPIGFAHIRNQVVGTLFQDIADGMPFEAISRRWKEKLHPLQYQRPTSPPSAGNVARAEKIFAELNLAPALKRRYATLEDVLKFEWRPRAKQERETSASGIFAGVTPKSKAAAKKTVSSVELPTQTMTWEKFQRTVLPTAVEMEVEVPHRGNFCGLTTAEDPDARPILQWDGLPGKARNPVSGYSYSMGSPAHQWKLTPGRYAKVTGVFRQPHTWQEPDKFAHQGEAVFLAIEGAQDTRKAGLALFPETLRSEVREVRATIEAFAKTSTMSGAENGTANGLIMTGNTRLRVRTVDGLANYVIDRMD